MRIRSSPGALEASHHSGRFVWFGLLLVAACLGALAARYLINDAIPFLTDVSPDMFGRFWPRRVWLLTHIAGSGVALVVGPFQFWSGLRQHSMLAHRWSGRVYVAGVIVGGAAAFYLAWHAGQSTAFAISLGTLGVVWWSTTAMAYVAIRLGHIGQHRQWALRSYVVTFTFVTTRTLAELGILSSLGDDPFATLVWLCWSMPLLATEVILQGRTVIAHRVAIMGEGVVADD